MSAGGHNQNWPKTLLYWLRLNLPYIFLNPLLNVFWDRIDICLMIRLYHFLLLDQIMYFCIVIFESFLKSKSKRKLRKNVNTFSSLFPSTLGKKTCFQSVYGRGQCQYKSGSLLLGSPLPSADKPGYHREYHRAS